MMLKKFLTVMVFTLCMTAGSLFTEMNEAGATDVYVFTSNGVEYYITKTRRIDFNGYYYVWLTGIRGGRAVDMIQYIYFPYNGTMFYQLVGQGGTIDEGYLASSGRAQEVYRAAKARNQDS